MKELYTKGLLQDESEVRCFVLGKSVSAHEGGYRTEKDGRVNIQPLLFSYVLDRAKGRMLKLCERVKNAPFLLKHRDKITKFLQPVDFDEKLFKKKPVARPKKKPSGNDAVASPLPN